jgi:hypothetical protein
MLLRRCRFAAFILSTKLGYFRPARRAVAFAEAFDLGVSFVWRVFFGAGLSHGTVDLRFIRKTSDSPSILAMGENVEPVQSHSSKIAKSFRISQLIHNE